ncbi:sodium:proton antiporter [Staphylococcus pasteuri]|uniref:cation:proton antiporter n=1 Tax=Staphylococcus TaxID=1279 RepID=UPI0008687ACE|nr:sodium:proton antiporter [Staphylococcus pasteuri]ODB50391.1 sodium:proton antiporter [Staphylococcus sp. AOAB]MCD9067429.1 sodium:proton antiporter [Staphylococcus pasteuri]MCE3022438.1 sodium:proton antiporter [Staphylococcus pasteuri]MCO0861236.1 sodium:proton antiporter [Staphylococcus pasteuri]MCO5360342.1 sodium:proton antiporter [Staphylococcus pasteuri]
MELLEAFLIFIFAVILSAIINNRFPKIPTAFIQIALGAAIFTLPIPIHFDFDSEVFMMAVIAPLLFVEGTHIKRSKLMEYRTPIILMAMALVFTTVIGVGYFIHWIWPELPMPAAFAIAAILCPTDAVAVSAITKGKILPKGAMSILEGESLLNDAAGIISFKIAVTALVTGMFSAVSAIEQFIVSTIIGILVGVILGILVVQLRVFLTANKGFKDNNTLTFIQLLTPFVIYFIAEELHASGIIAVVFAGLVHGLERDRLLRAQTELQINYSQIWNTLSYALNGFVFVVLGFIVPEVVIEIVKVEPDNLKFLIGITLLISLAIYSFRFIWVFLWYKDFYYPKNIQRYIEDEELAEEKPPNRILYSFIMTMCGIHGTISVSMALTLPTMMSHHQNFVYRNDLLFIASLMVLISLILAQIVLPLITKSENKDTKQGMTYQAAKILIIQSVIQQLKKNAKENENIDYRPLFNQYFTELSFLINVEPDNKDTKELHRLTKIAEEEETATLERLINKGKITSQELSNYRNIVELSKSYKEASFITKFSRFFNMIYLRFKARKNYRKHAAHTLSSEVQNKNKDKVNSTHHEKISVEQNNERHKPSRDQIEERRTEMLKSYKNELKSVQKIMRVVNHQITLRLHKEQNSSNVLETSLVVNQYYNLIRTLRKRQSTTQSRNNNAITNFSSETQLSLRLHAIYTERKFLDELIKQQKVTSEIAKQLRENINYNEIIIAEES